MPLYCDPDRPCLDCDPEYPEAEFRAVQRRTPLIAIGVLGLAMLLICGWVFLAAMRG